MAFDDDMADRLRCTISYANHLQLDYGVIEDEGQVDITQRDLDAFDNFYYSNSTFSFVRYTTTKAIDMREERSGRDLISQLQERLHDLQLTNASNSSRYMTTHSVMNNFGCRCTIGMKTDAKKEEDQLQVEIDRARELLQATRTPIDQLQHLETSVNPETTSSATVTSNTADDSLVPPLHGDTLFDEVDPSCVLM